MNSAVKIIDENHPDFAAISKQVKHISKIPLDRPKNLIFAERAPVNRRRHESVDKL